MERVLEQVALRAGLDGTQDLRIALVLVSTMILASGNSERMAMTA